MIEHDFDDVGVRDIGRIMDEMTRRRDCRVGVLGQAQRHCADQSRVDQRLVPLQIDHDVVPGVAAFQGHLRHAVGPRSVVAARHNGFESVARYR